MKRIISACLALSAGCFAPLAKAQSYDTTTIVPVEMANPLADFFGGIYPFLKIGGCSS